MSAMPETQQRGQTSLLSLPDELLEWICGIIDTQHEEEEEPYDNAMAFRERSDTLRALALASRRLLGIAQAILYRSVSLHSDNGTLTSFSAAIKDNSSLAWLVRDLVIQYPPFYRRAYRPEPVSDDDSENDIYQDVFSRLSKLEHAWFENASPYELVAALTALPEPTLRHLTLGSDQAATENSQQPWVAVWNCLDRFTQLRNLNIANCVNLSVMPDRHFCNVASLPQVTRLTCSNWLCIGALEPNLFGQILPNLTDLSFSVSETPFAPDVAMVALANLPSRLSSIEISSLRREPVGYLSKLPSSVRHLTLGRKSFVESELLAYLPTSPLISISFERDSQVGDVVLAQLTGPNRPPSLRRIRLDYVWDADAPAIREHFSWYPLKTLRGAMVRHPYELGPRWPIQGSEEGLRSALAAASAHGIEVEGSALHCVDWIEKYAAVYRDYVTEQKARGGAPEHSRDDLDADDGRR